MVRGESGRVLDWCYQLHWCSLDYRTDRHVRRSTDAGYALVPGATLNYADQALAPGAGRGEEPALIAYSQSRSKTSMTWNDLRANVAAAAERLRRLVIGPGDRVAAYAPNIPETVVAFLATAAVGAVWASCAPEFGLRAVIGRLAQLAPSVLLAIDGYCYGSKMIGRCKETESVVAAIPSVRHVVSIPYAGLALPKLELPEQVDHLKWEDLLSAVEPSARGPETLAVVADHPLYVLFSSGTTGRRR